jgi:phage tail sheath gpL-like
MAIPFKQIPANLLVPGQYEEIDNSLAGAQGDIKRVLIAGYKLPDAEAEALKPVQVLTADKAALICGAGSDVAIMAKAFLALNNVEECWLLPIAPPAAGGKFSRIFIVSGSGLKDGSVEINVNGQVLTATVSKNDEASAIASAIVAVINGNIGLPVEAEVQENTSIKITSLVKGYLSNYNNVSIVSKADGVNVAVGSSEAGTGGDNAFEMKTLFAQIADMRFNYIVWAFSSVAQIKNIADELDSRFEAMRQIGGRAFIALCGKLGSASEEGTMLHAVARINSPHIVLVPRAENGELPCEWASRWCAAACRILADDPAANTYDTKVVGLNALVSFTATERQKMLEAGIATYRLDSAGSVLIERLVTSYTENTDGGRDTSFLDVQVPETVDAVRTYINAEAKKRFKDWKLSSTNENFGSGAKVMSPGVFRSFLAGLYIDVFIKEKQWCQDFDAYKKSIIVEVKAGSKTRLEYRHQPNLIGQFYIGAGLLQFK